MAQLQFPLHFYSINLNFGLLDYVCVCEFTLCTLKYTNVRTHASFSLSLPQSMRVTLSLPLRLHNSPITRTTTTKIGTTTRDTMSVCCCVWCVAGNVFLFHCRADTQHSTGKAGTAKSQIKVSGCVAVAAVCGQSVKYFHHCW